MQLSHANPQSHSLVGGYKWIIGRNVLQVLVIQKFRSVLQLMPVNFKDISDSYPYSGVELRPWTFQWDLTLYLLTWTVSHINRYLHQWYGHDMAQLIIQKNCVQLLTKIALHSLHDVYDIAAIRTNIMLLRMFHWNSWNELMEWTCNRKFKFNHETFWISVS